MLAPTDDAVTRSQELSNVSPISYSTLMGNRHEKQLASMGEDRFRMSCGERRRPAQYCDCTELERIIIKAHDTGSPDRLPNFNDVHT